MVNSVDLEEVTLFIFIVKMFSDPFNRRKFSTRLGLLTKPVALFWGQLALYPK